MEAQAAAQMCVMFGAMPCALLLVLLLLIHACSLWRRYPTRYARQGGHRLLCLELRAIVLNKQRCVISALMKAETSMFSMADHRNTTQHHTTHKLRTSIIPEI